MYVGHILIGEEDTFFVSNTELVGPLVSLFRINTCSDCDRYEDMPNVIEKLVTQRTFFPRKHKYVIGVRSEGSSEPNLLEMAVVFPDHLFHDQTRPMFDRVLYAGFVHFTKNGPVVSGNSLGLSKAPGPTDRHVLKRCLGDNYWRGKF